MRFQCYRHDDGSAAPVDFVALIAGAVSGEAVHLRVHDACLTSEVFGSCKCDCKLQLLAAQRHISEQAATGRGGIIVYTFQEGRGIGLSNKIAAYHLQETQGLDTVEANIALGLPSENRRYDFVAPLLKRLNTQSVVLLTNNPFKVSSLKEMGVIISGRASVIVEDLAAPAAAYLATKVDRMGHLLEGSEEIAVTATTQTDDVSKVDILVNDTKRHMALHISTNEINVLNMRPFVTLTYAQSLDGSIARLSSMNGPAAEPPLLLSGPESMTMTHALRAAHDAILVGVGTVLADNPRLTVRLVKGRSPLPVVLDGGLRTPLNCTLVKQAAEMHQLHGGVHLVILTTAKALTSLAFEAFEAISALPGVAVEVCHPPSSLSQGADESKVHLTSALHALWHTYRCRSLMVEGGARIIGSFMTEAHLVDSLIVTIAPVFVGGLPAVARNATESGKNPFPDLKEQKSFTLGKDMIVYGHLDSTSSAAPELLFPSQSRHDSSMRNFAAVQVQSKL